MIIFRQNTMFIAIGGASSSGKTRILKSVKGMLDRQSTAHLDMDGYHKHDREDRLRRSEYPEQLEANDFNRLCTDLTELHQGISITIPMYDHASGKFGKQRLVHPQKIVFVEGLHATGINSICKNNLIDLRIFLDPEEDLRRSWKIKRDVVNRSYSYPLAVEQIEHRAPFVKEFIMKQRYMADALVQIESSHPGTVRYNVLLTQDIVNKHQSLRNIFSLSEVPQQGRHELKADYYLVTDVYPNQMIETILNLGLGSSSSTLEKLKKRTRSGSYTYAVRSLLGAITAIASEFKKGR